jgi:hypothetical protein
MPGPLYRLPDAGAELSQGDIVDDVPHVRLTGELEVIRQITGPKGRTLWAPFPYPPQEGKTPDAKVAGKTINLRPFHVQEGEYLRVLSRFQRAIVLNYDCDLVHDDDYCIVAVVRPMSGVNERDRSTIRENRNHSHFYLPEDDDLGFAEGYADLRQATCIDPAMLQSIGKLRASLSDVGVKALQAQFFKFVTRRELL